MFILAVCSLKCKWWLGYAEFIVSAGGGHGFDACRGHTWCRDDVVICSMSNRFVDRVVSWFLIGFVDSILGSEKSQLCCLLSA